MAGLPKLIKAIIKPILSRIGFFIRVLVATSRKGVIGLLRKTAYYYIYNQEEPD